MMAASIRAIHCRRGLIKNRVMLDGLQIHRWMWWRADARCDLREVNSVCNSAKTFTVVVGGGGGGGGGGNATYQSPRLCRRCKAMMMAAD